MNMPKVFQGESLTRLIQGALFGAVATMVIGFGWSGWTLGSSAEKMAAERVSTALVTAYAPICVERYNINATAEQRQAFIKASTWNRDTVIEEAGFATTPGSDSPNGNIADACAQALTNIIEKQATATN